MALTRERPVSWRLLWCSLLRLLDQNVFFVIRRLCRWSDSGGFWLGNFGVPARFVLAGGGGGGSWERWRWG